MSQKLLTEAILPFVMLVRHEQEWFYSGDEDF